MTKAERTQWWFDYPDATSATKSLPSVDCPPSGISSLTGVTSRSTICTWSLPTIDSDVSTGDGPSSEEDDDSSPDSTNNRREHCPWNNWDAFVQELDSSNVNRAVCFPAASATSGMPLEDDRSSLHREKIGLPPCLDNLCVARPVGKAEIDRTPAAKASMQKGVGSTPFQNGLG